MLSISCKVCLPELHIYDQSLDLFLSGKGVIFIVVTFPVHHRSITILPNTGSSLTVSPYLHPQIFLSSYNCCKSSTRVAALYWDKLSLFIHLCKVARMIDSSTFHLFTLALEVSAMTE